MAKILIPSKNFAVLAAVRETLEILAKHKTAFIERLAENHHLDPETLSAILASCVFDRERNAPVFTIVSGTAGLAPPAVHLSEEMCTWLSAPCEQPTPSPV